MKKKLRIPVSENLLFISKQATHRKTSHLHFIVCHRTCYSSQTNLKCNIPTQRNDTLHELKCLLFVNIICRSPISSVKAINSWTRIIWTLHLRKKFSIFCEFYHSTQQGSTGHQSCPGLQAKWAKTIPESWLFIPFSIILKERDVTATYYVMHSSNS